MAKVDDFLERRAKQVVLAIVARLAHRSPRQRILPSKESRTAQIGNPKPQENPHAHPAFLQNRLLAQVKSSRSINRFRILHGRPITAHAIWQPFGETRSGPARSGGRQSAPPCARTRASRSLWQSEPGSSTSLPYRKFRSVTASPPAGGLRENVTFVSSVTASFPSIRFCSTAHGYSLHFPAHQRAVQRRLEILQAWRDQTRRAWATTRVK